MRNETMTVEQAIQILIDRGVTPEQYEKLLKLIEARDKAKK